MHQSRVRWVRSWTTAAVSLMAASVIAVTTGPAAQAVDPGSTTPLDFGAVELGTVKTLPIPISLVAGEVLLTPFSTSSAALDGTPSTEPQTAFIATTGTCTSAGPASCSLSVSFAPSILGLHTMTLGVATCITFTGGGECGQLYTIQLSGSGLTPAPATISLFQQPVDNDAINSARAGSTIPLKFSVTKAGTPLTDLTLADVNVGSFGGDCGGGPVDAIEVYSGASGLQNLGGGFYQYNWKTPKGFKGQCRTLNVTVLGAVRTADFTFN
ncbi:MAG TPA: PxKF domain-containing protein [Ornithinibacter sp.]|nr:PxKF domain-containing protein [Ornithinibacter sp.]